MPLVLQAYWAFVHDSLQLLYFSVQGSTLAAKPIMTHPLIAAAANNIFAFTFLSFELLAARSSKNFRPPIGSTWSDFRIRSNASLVLS